MRKNLILLILIILPLLSVFAQQLQLPEKPSPAKMVNDFAEVLSAEEQQALEQKLVTYYDSTSTQVVIVTLATLDGYPIEDYGLKLAREWGIGQEGKDNGLLILVVRDDRKMRIEVGYGMEATVPDVMAKRIISNIMAPEFKQGNYYAGLDNATTAIIQLSKGEFKMEESDKDGSTGESVITMLVILFVIFFLGRFFGGGKNKRGSGYTGYSSRGYYSGGGFGGSSSSGFDFGGGGFGGGGASGDW